MKYCVSIEDSIRRILLTPKGQRVMRPNYGSNILSLVDRRYTDELQVDLIMEIYTALSANEKRILIKKVTPKIEKNEKILIEIHYENRENNENGVVSLYV